VILSWLIVGLLIKLQHNKKNGKFINFKYKKVVPTSMVVQQTSTTTCEVYRYKNNNKNKNNNNKTKTWVFIKKKKKKQDQNLGIVS
jgi:hypothetical protein